MGEHLVKLDLIYYGESTSIDLPASQWVAGNNNIASVMKDMEGLNLPKTNTLLVYKLIIKSGGINL